MYMYVYVCMYMYIVTIKSAVGVRGDDVKLYVKISLSSSNPLRQVQVVPSMYSSCNHLLRVYTTLYIIMTCYMLHATCYMLHATCYMLHATCYMLHATCTYPDSHTYMYICTCSSLLKIVSNVYYCILHCLLYTILYSTLLYHTTTLPHYHTTTIYIIYDRHM
jgi:hypothetical protein